MSCGPWAMELGAQLLGLKFRKLLKLEACSLALGACIFWSVAVFPGPCFMELFYDSSASHKLRFERLETSSFYSSYTCRLDQGPGSSSSQSIRSTSRATSVVPDR